MSDEANGAKRFDPMEPWRGMRDVYLDAWAKTMVEMVNTDAYAQATGICSIPISPFPLRSAKPWKKPCSRRWNSSPCRRGLMSFPLQIA